MISQIVLVVFTQTIFIQSISCQCIGLAAPLVAAPCASAVSPAISAAPVCASPWAAASYGFGASNAFNLVASNGGGLAISSASPLAPNGVSVVSENAIEGAVGISGALPFLGAVALEGLLPTAGAGAVAYGCGNGEIAILSEDLSALGRSRSTGPLGYGVEVSGYGSGTLGCGNNLASSYGYNGIAGIGGCGCGLHL